MSKSLDALTQKILAFVLYATAFLTPLVFVPMTMDFFTPHKRLVVMALASIALLTWITRITLQKRLQVTLTPATVPLIILAIIFIISSFLQSPNVTQAFMGETGIMLSLVIILVTTTSSLHKTGISFVAFRAVLLSLALVSLVTIVQFIQIGKLTGISWLESALFNPAGGPLNLLSISVPLLVAVVAYIWKAKHAPVLFVTSGLLMLVASVMSLILIYSHSLQFMPFTAAWAVAIGALQNPMAALLGTGPNSYQAVYTILRPASVNLTGAWNISFVNSANFYLHLLTTTGLVAFLAYIFAGVKMAAAGFGRQENTYLFTYSALLVAGLIAQLVLPPNIVSLTLLFVTMIMISLELGKYSTSATHRASTEQEMETASEKYDLLYWFAAALAGVLVLYNGYLASRAYASEYIFGASLVAAQENRGTDVYNLQNQAIRLKPYEAQYRLAYAQTNMALASALASQENVPEDVQGDIVQLIQQAIREAKVAVQLEPANSVAWQNLAVIYQQLIGVAEGADQWTVEAYQQAIALDPRNPQLLLDFGGIFYGAENYEQAVSLFTQAVQLKPDWANAYYNLAVAYREAGQTTQALQAMRVVVELVDPASPDYQTAQDELEELRIKAREEGQATQETEDIETAGFSRNEEPELRAPSPRPSPVIEEEIVLPEDAGLE